MTASIADKVVQKAGRPPLEARGKSQDSVPASADPLPSGPMSAAAPYRVTPVFNSDSLPAALRGDHSTKAGVWGIIRVIEGRLMLRYADGSVDRLLEPGRYGHIAPQQLHRVEPLGPMRMQVEFYDRDPAGA